MRTPKVMSTFFRTGDVTEIACRVHSGQSSIGLRPGAASGRNTSGNLGFLDAGGGDGVRFLFVDVACDDAGDRSTMVWRAEWKDDWF